MPKRKLEQSGKSEKGRKRAKQEEGKSKTNNFIENRQQTTAQQRKLKYLKIKSVLSCF